MLPEASDGRVDVPVAPTGASNESSQTLPVGTVTFLFTDVEGSTRLVAELGDAQWATLLAASLVPLREAAMQHGGSELGTEGDGAFFAFPSASAAVTAASAAQDALAGGRISVRMGIHTGEPLLTPGGYVGADLHKVARICAAGHGGQVLLSEETRRLIDARVDVTALGSYRLRGFERPVTLFQLGSGVFPSLRAVRAAGLPATPTSLVGRERELADLERLLEDDEVRLVTLVGPGGAGKTRLAQEAALRCRDRFADGVFWVPLQDVRESGLVLPTVAQALGTKRALREHLAEQHVLIVLDNVEQVADASAEVAALIMATGRSKIVATSREPLRLSGERRFPVQPLPQDDATALFAERARAVNPSFQPSSAVAAVVERLDRLPLAIELAAARLNAMSVEGLLARMERLLPLLAAGPRDAPERQRTLTATLAWSYELLEEAERRLFRRLAVFAGGFELEAAETVCAAELDTLQALVDKSLVQRSPEGRLRLLETVREYAGMSLQDSGELDELSGRHAAWALELAERAKPAFVTGERQDEWLPRLEAERANLRAARDWLRRSDDAERGLRLAVAAAPLWQIRGPIHEGREWLTRALGDAAGGPAEARGEALRLLSRFALAQGDLQAAADYARAGVEFLRELPLGPTLAAALTDLANALSATGEFEQARIHYQESLDLYRRGADDASAVSRGRVLGNLGYVALIQGDLERAPALLREALTSGGALDIRYTALHTLGLVHLARGECEEARAHLVDSLRLSAVAQDDAVAYCLVGFGALALEEGDERLAAILLASAETLFARAGAKPNPYEDALVRSATAEARARLGSDAFEAARRAGAELSSTEAIHLALDEGRS